MNRQNALARVLRLVTLLTLPLLFSIPASSMAIGIIIPVPPRRPDVPVSVPPTLKTLAVSSSIKDNIARTRIVHVFHNSNSRPVEADFYFPVPVGADITDFVLYMEGKPVKGEVLDKDKAQGIYRQIVRQMRDPGLIDWTEKNLFRVRVFPIPAHGEQKLEIELSQVLTADQGYFRYYLPLKSGHTVSATSLPRVDIKVAIDADSPLRNIYSPTHKIDTTTSDGKHTGVAVKDDHATHLKDFALYYEMSDKDIAVSLLTHRTTGTEGFFFLRISPPWDTQTTPAPQSQSGEYVFVIDSSGSMAEGEKMEQGRKALRYCVNLLGPNDRFNIIRFSTTVESYQQELTEASPVNRKAAINWIDELQARGGTNISDALNTALGQRKINGTKNTSGTTALAEPLFTVVFLTDGLPTVGQTNPDAIIKAVREQSGGNVRIFTFGLGNDVNTRLLDSIADATRAASDYVAPEADLEVPVSRFFDKVSRPALFNLELKIPGAGVTEVYPAQLPDLFYGAELAVFGRYKTSGTSPVILSGTIAGTRQEYRFEKEFPESTDKAPFVEKLWATRKVAWLLDQVRKAGESKEVKVEIEELALKYSIVTPYTSYLAMEDEASVSQPSRRSSPVSGESRGVRRYEHSNSPSSRNDMSGVSAASQTMNFKADSGAGAVQTAQRLRDMRTADILMPAGPADLKTLQKKVGRKSFINANGIWKDTTITGTEKSVIKVQYLSDAWFRLSEDFPHLREYFSMGEQMQVLLPHYIVLHVGPEGLDMIDDGTKALIKSALAEINLINSETFGNPSKQSLSY